MNNSRKPSQPSQNRIDGRWDIVEMDEFDEEYFDLGEEKPYLTITQSGTDTGRGEYAVGLSTGSLIGALRQFGNETIFIFGYAGMDEMDPVDGAGWVRLTAADTLEGEFLGVLRRFKAQRTPLKRARPVRGRR